LMAALVQGGLTRRVVPKLGEVRSMTIGMTLAGLAMFGYGFATQSWMIYAMLVVGSLGGIAGPATQGLISRNVPANEQGAVQGALTSLASVAGFIAPLMATSLFGYFVSDQAPAKLPGISFWLGGVLTFTALGLAMRTVGRHPPQSVTPATPSQA
jgi:MFS transporter, DHA1 family, tetracycline resistance protein